MDSPDFKFISPHTINAKHKDGSKKSESPLQIGIKNKAKGIVAAPSYIVGSKFIDDQDVQILINPMVFPQESHTYMNIKTHEKLIANQI